MNVLVNTLFCSLLPDFHFLYFFSLLPDFHYVFAAECIWSFFRCGSSNDRVVAVVRGLMHETTCKQRFDDCVSGKSISEITNTFPESAVIDYVLLL